eukprot:7240385-Prymnesium_polylepis.2
MFSAFLDDGKPSFRLRHFLTSTTLDDTTPHHAGFWHVPSRYPPTPRGLGVYDHRFPPQYGLRGARPHLRRPVRTHTHTRARQPARRSDGRPGAHTHAAARVSPSLRRPLLR